MINQGKCRQRFDDFELGFQAKKTLQYSPPANDNLINSNIKSRNHNANIEKLSAKKENIPKKSFSAVKLQGSNLKILASAIKENKSFSEQKNSRLDQKNEKKIFSENSEQNSKMNVEEEYFQKQEKNSETQITKQDKPLKMAADQGNQHQKQEFKKESMQSFGRSNDKAFEFDVVFSEKQSEQDIINALQPLMFSEKKKSSNSIQKQQQQLNSLFLFKIHSSNKAENESCNKILNFQFLFSIFRGILKHEKVYKLSYTNTSLKEQQNFQFFFEPQNSQISTESQYRARQEAIEHQISIFEGTYTAFLNSLSVSEQQKIRNCCIQVLEIDLKQTEQEQMQRLKSQIFLIEVDPLVQKIVKNEELEVNLNSNGQFMLDWFTLKDSTSILTGSTSTLYWNLFKDKISICDKTVILTQLEIHEQNFVRSQLVAEFVEKLKSLKKFMNSSCKQSFAENVEIRGNSQKTQDLDQLTHLKLQQHQQQQIDNLNLQIVIIQNKGAEIEKNNEKLSSENEMLKKQAFFNKKLLEQLCILNPENKQNLQNIYQELQKQYQQQQFTNSDIQQQPHQQRKEGKQTIPTDCDFKEGDKMQEETVQDANVETNGCQKQYLQQNQASSKPYQNLTFQHFFQQSKALDHTIKKIQENIQFSQENEEIQNDISEIPQLNHESVNQHEKQKQSETHQESEINQTSPLENNIAKESSETSFSVQYGQNLLKKENEHDRFQDLSSIYKSGSYPSSSLSPKSPSYRSSINSCKQKKGGYENELKQKQSNPTKNNNYNIYNFSNVNNTSSQEQQAISISFNKISQKSSQFSGVSQQNETKFQKENQDSQLIQKQIYHQQIQFNRLENEYKEKIKALQRIVGTLSQQEKENQETIKDCQKKQVELRENLEKSQENFGAMLKQSVALLESKLKTEEKYDGLIQDLGLNVSQQKQLQNAETEVILLENQKLNDKQVLQQERNLKIQEISQKQLDEMREKINEKINKKSQENKQLKLQNEEFLKQIESLRAELLEKSKVKNNKI